MSKLGKMLNIQPGVLIIDALVDLELDGLKLSMWIEVLLSFMLGELIFETPSIFNNADMPDFLKARLEESMYMPHYYQ